MSHSPAVIELGKDTTCRTNLFAAPQETYGLTYRNDFFQQYKLFVESVNYTSELKLKIHSFFLTINTALITAIGLGYSSQKEISPSVWHLMGNHSSHLKKFLFSIDLLIPLVFLICYLIFASFS